MNNLNSVIVEGNLTKDPVTNMTAGGKTVCKFTIANNRYYKVGDENQQEVSFFGVETWARVAESCGDYLSKGRGVRVVGRLKQERWTGQDERRHERIVIVAEHVEFKPQPNRLGGDSSEQGESRIEQNGAVSASDPALEDADVFAAEAEDVEFGDQEQGGERLAVIVREAENGVDSEGESEDRDGSEDGAGSEVHADQRAQGQRTRRRR